MPQHAVAKQSGRTRFFLEYRGAQAQAVPRIKGLGRKSLLFVGPVTTQQIRSISEIWVYFMILGKWKGYPLKLGDFISSDHALEVKEVYEWPIELVNESDRADFVRDFSLARC